MLSWDGILVRGRSREPANRHIQKRRSLHEIFQAWSPGNFTMAMGIAIDSQGFVYVDDANTSFKDGSREMPQSSPRMEPSSLPGAGSTQVGPCFTRKAWQSTVHSTCTLLTVSMVRVGSKSSATLRSSCGHSVLGKPSWSILPADGRSSR